MLLFLMFYLSNIWQFVKCDGQMELSGKKCTQFDVLLENFGKIIFVTKREEGQKIKKITTELSKKLRMLEAVFGKTTEEESENYSKDDEYKCLKKRCNKIYQNDPPLSQLLEHLVTVQIYAKEALEYDNANELEERIQTLKGSLAYAVIFMTKRHKIRLNSERQGEEKVETNDQKSLWTELANYYEEFELDKICIKCHKNSEYNGNKNGRKKENKGREERFFRFVARTLETKWEGNAFSNGQNDDDDDDGIRSRRRRKRMTIGLPPAQPPSRAPEDDSFNLVPFLVVCAVLVLLLCLSLLEGLFRSRPPRNSNQLVGGLGETMPRTNQLIQPRPPRIENEVVSAYNATPYVTFASQHQENNICSICLNLILPNKVVQPLPCHHCFHIHCIEGWLKVHSNCPMCRTDFEVSAGRIEMAHHNGGIGSSNWQMNGTPTRDGTAHGVAVDDQPEEVVIAVRSNADNGTSNRDGAAHGVSVDDHPHEVVIAVRSNADNGISNGEN